MACKIRLSSLQTPHFTFWEIHRGSKFLIELTSHEIDEQAPKLKNMETNEELKKIGSLGPKYYCSLKICILLLLGLKPFDYLHIVFLEFRRGTGDVGQWPKTNGSKKQKVGGYKIRSTQREHVFGPKISLSLSLIWLSISVYFSLV